jgi:hypothetical protein
MARVETSRRSVRRGPSLGAVLAVLALTTVVTSCAEAPGSAGPTSTLDPLSIRLVEWYDPIALATGHEWGRACSGHRVSGNVGGEATRAEAHAFWVVDCPREPGDRTIYFLLEEDTRAAIEAAGGRIGSGNGLGDSDQGLLSQSWEFTMPGAMGFGRITSTDIGEDQLRILITLDVIAD